MNYDRPELRDRLAADYVLGSLRGGARRRLEREIESDPAMGAAVALWEKRLHPLVEAVPPIAPRPQVWMAIEQRIRQPAREAQIVRLPDPAARAMPWRGIAFVATAIAASLAVYIAVRPPAAADQSPVAILNDGSGHAAFVVMAGRDARVISMTQLAGGMAPAGRAYQLWLLPKGGKPRPLGVMPPTRTVSFTLSGDAAAAMPTADGIAISLEPAGGSPTGQPTGSILFNGPIVIRD